MKKVISLVACALVLTLAGCASKQPVQPKPVKSISLLPVLMPDKLFLHHMGGSGSPYVAYNAAQIKSNVLFLATYEDFRKSMGVKMTEAVMRELAAEGFKVQVIAAPETIRDSDGVIHYKNLLAHDAVMDMNYFEVGMHTNQVIRHYKPIVNTYAGVVRPSSQKNLIEEKYYYGGYKNNDEYWNVSLDPKCILVDFDDLIQRSSLVRECYDEGIQKMAKRLAKDFSTKLVQVN